MPNEHKNRSPHQLHPDSEDLNPSGTTNNYHNIKLVREYGLIFDTGGLSPLQ